MATNVTGANTLPGLGALMKRPSGGGIDFMAIARGEQIARDANWQDVLRAQQSEQLALQSETARDQMNALRSRREAQAYVAPMITNLQLAVDSGISPVDYFIEQRAAVMNDPNFQRMTPEVQRQVLATMTNPVRSQIQDLQKLNDLSGANRLAQAYGLSSASSPLQSALSTGGAAGVLDALRQLGRTVVEAEDGTVLVDGVSYPRGQLLNALNTTQTPAGIFQLNAQQEIAAQQAQAAEAERQRRQQEQQAAYNLVFGQGQEVATPGATAGTPPVSLGAGASTADVIRAALGMPPATTPGVPAASAVGAGLGPTVQAAAGLGPTVQAAAGLGPTVQAAAAQPSAPLRPLEEVLASSEFLQMLPAQQQAVLRLYSQASTAPPVSGTGALLQQYANQQANQKANPQAPGGALASNPDNPLQALIQILQEQQAAAGTPASQQVLYRPRVGN